MSMEDLARRIRGEYSEMPGLRLTLPQACRLWQLDLTTCQRMLQKLIDDGFLMCTADDVFIAQPSVERRQLKSVLAPRVFNRRTA
jgi:hypothetical protein